MKIKKILAIIVLLVMCIWCVLSNRAYASFNINSANLVSKGVCQQLLIDTKINAPIIVTKVFYKDEGPAYCVNVEKNGVGELGSYAVTVNEAYNNPLVWRVITNGYPYKSFDEMGVYNLDEAYTATKQAVYCVLYDFDRDNFAKYQAIGDAGARTLQAMKNMVSAARSNTNIVKPSNNIDIVATTEWELEENKEYISRNFKITSACAVQNCTISLNNDKEKEIKITDMQGNETTSPQGNEFKIKIPVKMLEIDDSFQINVTGKLTTKPVLFGNANDVNKQNYALAGEMYEGGEGSLTVHYSKNNSKLKIIKQDEDGTKTLEGVEFQILDEKGEIVYSNLKTNKDGEIIIEGILPGKYFLEEVSTIDGYELLDEKLEFDMSLNEELKITIKNRAKETKIEKEIKEKEKTYSYKMNKLPVTGM